MAFLTVPHHVNSKKYNILKSINFCDKITLILDPPGHRKTNQANINIHIQFQSDVKNTNIKLRYYTASGSGENIAHAYNGDSSHAQTIFLTTITGLDVGDSVSIFQNHEVWSNWKKKSFSFQMVAMSAGSLFSQGVASNHFTGRLIEPYNWIWKPAYD